LFSNLFSSLTDIEFEKGKYAMRLRLFVLIACSFAFATAGVYPAFSWTPLAIEDDPLVRMPGTQPGQGVDLTEPFVCLSCHGLEQTDGQGNIVAPGFSWAGSMMAQAARDPLFWAAITVAAQDSIWAVGNPNAVDICERCHFPEGWLGGRCDPANASAMTHSDFDGVHCDACHRMWDPFFETTHNGTREGNDWTTYWDEVGNTGPGSGTPSQNGADQTYGEDASLVGTIKLFSGSDFYQDYLPKSIAYNENANGQYFVSFDNALVKRRASFADTVPHHSVLYSRYHKSKFFCASCHDVSNPVLANLAFIGTPPGDGTTILPTEENSAYSYYHVERAFSEFMLSAYGQQGGAATNPEFQAQGAPSITWAGKCQDCHMRDVKGKGCDLAGSPLRPDESIEHPNSGAPLHHQQGGNLWMTYILATLDSDLPNTYDEVNFQLLTQGPDTLTLDMYAGLSPTDRGAALLAASDWAKRQLQLAATIKNLSYDPTSGNLSFRILNNAGHKLITAFPEGRRMFVNIKAYANGSLIHEINPYDYTAGTLKGPKFPASPDLSPNEAYVDELVYEVHLKSDLTGESEKTYHVALATGRYKDNRIPPKGFDIENAGGRLCEPLWHGVSDLEYFTTDEYSGGYDDVQLAGTSFPSGADRIKVALYYQGTSREYIESLRDEINGTAGTLSEPTPSGEPHAYIVQTDPFFRRLKAWGNTIWQLWYHNHGLDGLGAYVPGIVPFQMTQATWGGVLPDIFQVYPRQQEPTVPMGTMMNALNSALGYTCPDCIQTVRYGRVRILGVNFGPSQLPGDQARIGDPRSIAPAELRYDTDGDSFTVETVLGGVSLRIGYWSNELVGVYLYPEPGEYLYALYGPNVGLHWLDTWLGLWVVKDNGGEPVASNVGPVKVLTPLPD
jgi:hypothetical protein